MKLTIEQYRAMNGKKRISADSLKKTVIKKVKKQQAEAIERVVFGLETRYRTIKEDLENMTEFERGLERKARERKLMKR